MPGERLSFLFHKPGLITMQHKSFPDEFLTWNSPSELPADRLVLTKISSVSKQMPARLVFARTAAGGVVLGSGDQLSEAWSVVGWLDTDIEIELLDTDAMAACPSALIWEACPDGSEIAEDGFGGHYVIDRSRKRIRLRHQIDIDRVISIHKNADPHLSAQTHHDTWVRRNLKNNPGQ